VSCVKTLKNAGLRVVASFIIGFLWEDRKDVMKTVKFAKRCGADYAQFTSDTLPGNSDVRQVET